MNPSRRPIVRQPVKPHQLHRVLGQVGPQEMPITTPIKPKLIRKLESDPRGQRGRRKRRRHDPEWPISRSTAVAVRAVAVAVAAGVGDVGDGEAAADAQAVLGDGGPVADAVVGLGGQGDGGGALLGLGGVVGGDDEAEVARGRVDGYAAGVGAVPFGDELARGGVAVGDMAVG